MVNDEEMNRAIATILGWTLGTKEIIDDTNGVRHTYSAWKRGNEELVGDEPPAFFCTDKNTHGQLLEHLEKVNRVQGFGAELRGLLRISSGEMWQECKTFCVCFAPARIVAEAFLRAVYAWKPDWDKGE